MIIAENLTKHFDNFVAVEAASFHVQAGEVLVLLGPNGAGKTTTVRMLTSILTPTYGRAFVNGYDVVHQADRVRSSIGVLTEHHGLYGRMNAVEYLEFYGQLYRLDTHTRKSRSDSLLEQFGLGDARSKRLGEYSKGMRQKLALVRALLHDPPALLLDEPTSAMDPESARMVRDAILSLRSKERAILLCTHNLVEAEELAANVAIIRHGRILMCDAPARLKSALLGPVEFQATLAVDLDGWLPDLPPGVKLSGKGSNWLRFQIEHPETANPILLKQMLENHLQVVTFQEAPRSLEQAYLAAVTQGAELKQND